MCYNNREVLRRVWISEMQDRHRYASDDTMREIVESIDDMITHLSEDQAKRLL